MNLKKKSSKLLVITFFVLFFIYGVCTVKDYGISWDEAIQRQHCLVNYKYVVPSVSDIVTDTVNFPELPSLENYTVYGIAVQMPTIIIEHLFSFQFDWSAIFLMRHFYVFLWFFLSSIFFYKMCLLLTENKWQYALLGTLIYVVSPRILADAFYNIKDSLALSLFTINVYCGIRYIQKPNWRTSVTLAVVSALCVNTRIVGAVVLASCLLIAFIKKSMEGQWKKQFLLTMVIGLGTILIYIVMTPRAWADPIGTIFATAKKFSDFTVWNGEVYLLGRKFWADNLPWYYLFAWIMVTIPAIYLFFMFIGSLAWIRQSLSVCRDKLKDSKLFWEWLFVFLTLLIPILYFIIKRPVLYNGWRHFYFAWCPMALCALLGVIAIAKKSKRSAMVFAAVAIIINGSWFVLHHAYAYVYFNPVVREYAKDHFEKDYWAVAEGEVMREVVEMDDSPMITMTSTTPNGLYQIPPEDVKRVELIESVKDADYVLHRYVTTLDDEWTMDFENRKEVASLSVGDIKLYSALKKEYQLYATSLVGMSPEGNLYYGINDLSWEKGEGAGTYVGTFDNPVEIAKIVLHCENKEVAEKTKVYISTDTQSWINVSNDERASVAGKTISVFCREETIIGIKIECEESNMFPYELHLYQKEELEQNPRQVIEKVLGHENSPGSVEAIDGDLNTRWNTESQHEGQVFDVMLTEATEISGIQLDTGFWPDDYPRNLRIFLSEDGENFREVSYDTRDWKIYLFEKTRVKQIRLITGVQPEPVQNDWSISEVLVLTEE